MIKLGKTAKTVAVLAIATCATLGLSIPAQAASNASPCKSTAEVCRVTLNSFGGGVVSFSTYFAGYSGTRTYQIVKGVYGANLCSGTMGLYDSRSCTTSYVGQITFTFYKNQGPSGTVAIGG